MVLGGARPFGALMSEEEEGRGREGEGIGGDNESGGGAVCVGFDLMSYLSTRKLSEIDSQIQVVNSRT